MVPQNYGGAFIRGGAYNRQNTVHKIPHRFAVCMVTIHTHTPKKGEVANL